jgi:osmotically-inducible protein OsmY
MQRVVGVSTTNKTDSELKRDVERELQWDTRIDEAMLGVTVDRGVVTLHGVVERWADKHAAEEAVLRVAGVRDIANEIDIRPSWATAKSDADLARAVRAALEWNRLVPDRAIHSSVCDQGDVTLTGTVKTLAERDEAERAVRQIDGVRFVTNHIAVDTPRIEPDDVRSAIRHALGRHVVRELHHIGVEVVGDTVVLTGSVDSWRERRAVLGAAKGTIGVTRIDDRLHIG